MIDILLEAATATERAPKDAPAAKKSKTADISNEATSTNDTDNNVLPCTNDTTMPLNDEGGGKKKKARSAVSNMNMVEKLLFAFYCEISLYQDRSHLVKKFYMPYHQPHDFHGKAQTMQPRRMQQQCRPRRRLCSAWSQATNL